MPDPARLTVALLGATGFVGRHLARVLLERGHSLRALVRDREKARRALPAGVSWVSGDASERRALLELASGADAIVNTVGIRRELPPDTTFERAHPGITAAAIDAAKATGTRRFVLISALGTRANASTNYHRSKYLAEQLLRQSGLEWTIIRPSLIHGPDGEFMKMAKDWSLGRAAPFFALPYFARASKPAGFPPIPKPESALLQPVHVDDVAAAVAESLVREEAIGEVYPLVGPEIYDWPTLLTVIRDALPLSDGKRRPLPLPGVLAAAAAKAAELVGLGGALPFGPSEPVMAMEDNTAEMDKVRHHLGLRTAAFLPTMRAYASKI